MFTLMKKNNIVYLLVSLILTTFVLGCSQDPIFSDIAQEIKLDDPTVRGNVHSMVQLGNNLYATNGKIVTKPISQKAGWKEHSSPDEYVTKVASDEGNLYALVTKQADKGDSYSYRVFVQSGAKEDWKEITDTSSSNSPITIFDNGDSSGNRQAYLRDSTGVKELNGNASYDELRKVSGNGASTSTVAAAAYNGTTYFADTLAFCSDGTNLFRANGSTIQYYDTTQDPWKNGPSMDEEPTSFAYYKESDSSNYILVGTKSGIKKVTLSEHKPTAVSSFGSNADTAFGTYIALNVFAFPEEPGSCYVSIVKKTSSRYNGLWGYYSDRGNWNYE